MLPKAIGGERMNRVRQYRLAAGMTQDALARAARCTTQTIYNIERRGSTPRLGLALRIAQVLDAPLEDVFPPEGNAEESEESA